MLSSAFLAGFARPSIVPVAALDLDMRAGLQPAGTTFTRASAKNVYDSSGKLTAIASGAFPITYDPETLQLLGALIEDQNLTSQPTWNDDLSNAAWTKTGLLPFGSGSVANSTGTLDPWDTNTADLIVEDASAGNHGFSRTALTVTSGTQHSLQVMLKPAGRRYATVYIYEAGATANGTWARFDLQQGVVRESGKAGTGAAPIVALALSLKNGFFQVRLSGTVKSTAITSVDVAVLFSNSDASGAVVSYTGDGASGMYFGGLMVEGGLNVFSSFIGPTAGTAGSRNRDLLTYPATDLNVAAGTIVVTTGKGARPGATLLDTTNGGTTGIRIDHVSTNPARGFINGVTLTPSAANDDFSGRNVALAWDGFGSFLYTGSKKAVLRQSGATPGTPACGTSLALGGRVGNTNLSYRPIKRARFWTRVLSQEELDAVFAQGGVESPDALGRILCVGDSLTAGTGATNAYTDSWPALLRANLGRGVRNEGVGGNTSTQIMTRANRLPECANWTHIIEAGRNNFASASTVLADIEDMVSHCTSGRFIVLSILNRRDTASEYQGGADYDAIMAINASLSSEYGANYLDWRSVLVQAYDPGTPQDVIDHGRDCPPSTLIADGLHMNTAGYAVAEAAIRAKLAALGF
jgi:lysophospholipase L1-like esterase